MKKCAECGKQIAKARPSGRAVRKDRRFCSQRCAYASWARTHERITVPKGKDSRRA